MQATHQLDHDISLRRERLAWARP